MQRLASSEGPCITDAWNTGMVFLINPGVQVLRHVPDFQHSPIWLGAVSSIETLCLGIVWHALTFYGMFTHFDFIDRVWLRGEKAEFEGSWPEWCISSMICSRNTPFCSGTLEVIFNNTMKLSSLFYLVSNILSDFHLSKKNPPKPKQTNKKQNRCVHDCFLAPLEILPDVLFSLR